MHLETIKLECVSWEDFDAVFSLYLICNVDDDGFYNPVRLGRGRFATVAAASANPDPSKPAEFFALKFLSQDRESAAFSRNARSRYFLELAQSTGVLGGTNVVQVRGSSRLCASVAEYAYEHVKSSEKNREELAFETSHPKATKGIEETAAKNASHLDTRNQPIHDDFLKQVQGDFFVMPAEEGSLEDFLIDWRPWHERKFFEIQPKKSRQLADLILKNEVAVKNFLTEIQKESVRKKIHAGDYRRSRKRGTDLSHPAAPRWPEDDCGGLTVLNYIGSYVPSVKTRIILKLVDRLLEGVSTLHSRNEQPANHDRDERAANHDRDEQAESNASKSQSDPVAHRDLKLGNYLFSVLRRDVVLGDLGFVAPSSIGGTMGGASLAETGMQALGSRLFRAPEQRDALPAPDVRFRVLNENRIGFFGSGHVEIEPGDQLEVPDLTFGKSRDHRVSILTVEQTDGHRTEAVLCDPIIDFHEEMKSEDFLSFLMKPSGQHTDIFAIGCMLYYLASGGKNPEDFYDSCLKISIGKEVSRSCLSLALSLCQDDARTIKEDAGGLGPSKKKEHEDWMEAVFESTASIVRQELIYSPAHRKINRIRNSNSVDRHVEYWRKSPQVRNFLCDTQDISIPFPIVYEIIRCMVRDKEDSYVTRGPESQTRTLQQIDCSKIVVRISARIQQILKHSASAKPDISDLWAREELDLFYAARICAHKRPRSASPEAEAAVASSPPSVDSSVANADRGVNSDTKGASKGADSSIPANARNQGLSGNSTVYSKTPAIDHKDDPAKRA